MREKIFRRRLKACGSPATFSAPVAVADEVLIFPEARSAHVSSLVVRTTAGSWASPGGKVIRVSAQLYNAEDDYRRLAALLVESLRAS